MSDRVICSRCGGDFVPGKGCSKCRRHRPAELRFDAPAARSLFDRPDIDAETLEAGLDEYRATKASAQTLARRWGCDVEAVYRADIEYSKRIKAREREIKAREREMV